MTQPALPAAIQVLERGWLSSNNILLFSGGEATLVDAGYVGHAPQTVALVKSALAARRLETRLARIFNTHSHSDHIGGNAALKAAFGAAITIPRGIEDMIARWDEEALLLTQARQRGERFAHDATLDDGEEFEMGGLAWKAYAAPGHDMAALVFHCERERILISGDALWQDGFGIVFAELLGSDDGLAATRRTIDMISRLDVATVIPGHGSPFGDFDDALERAYKRVAAFEQDPARMGRNAVKACFTFNLLDLGRLQADRLGGYLAGVPFFHDVGTRVLGLADDEFAEWLLAELLKSRAVEIRDGWILPTMAP